MNSEQTQIFQDFVQESLQQSLPDMKLKRVEDPDQGDPIQWLDPIHVSIMRFQGDGMQGNAILGCDLAFLQRTCPQYDAEDPNRLQVVQDWIGELSNLILGRLKNKLLPFGTVLKLNPPSVTEATGKIFDLYATQSQNFRMWFSCEKDYICLSFSIDVHESIDLHVTSTYDESQLQPGDAIYRLNEMKHDGNAKGSRRDHGSSLDMVSTVRSGISIDEDSLSSEDFDFVDDVVEPERLHQSRAEDKAPAWAQKVTIASPSVSSSSPAPSQTQAQTHAATPIKKGGDGRRILESMEWPQHGELVVKFRGGIAYSLAPQKLLDSGCSALTVEGFLFNLERSTLGIRVTVAELQMSIEQVLAA